MRQGRYAEAEPLVRAALKVRPNDAAVFHLLGVTLEGLDRDDEALAAYESAIAANPRSAEACVNLSHLRRRRFDLDGAREAAEDAVDANPGLWPAQLVLAVVAARQDDAPAIARSVAELARRFTDAASSLVEFGRTATLRGEGADGEAATWLALQIGPESPAALCNLAARRCEQGRFDEAVDLIRRGHRLGSATPLWAFPSAEWVVKYERAAAVAVRVRAALHAGKSPSFDDDPLFVLRTYLVLDRPAEGVRWFAQAVEGEAPEDVGALARFVAADAAARAARRDPTFAATARAELAAGRLAGAAAVLARPSLADEFRRDLARLRLDPLFTALRTVGADAARTAEERDAWSAEWREVDAELARLGPAPTATRPAAASRGTASRPPK